MRTVGEVIARRNAEASGALIGYLPVGFPTLDESVEAAVALVENGVDALELGLPYSDPVMDGPVIQAATQQALANGFRLAHGFEAVRRITERVDAPVLIMTYWNPVVQYGVDRFAEAHEQSLADMDLKYADVLPAADVKAWLESLPSPAPVAGR